MTCQARLPAQQNTVTASISMGADGALPGSIEWMPGGEHEIYASKGGKAVTVRVVVDEATADVLNEQLQQRILASTDGVASRPYIDFDHDGGRAAALPLRFYWEDGIRLEVEWTASGKMAIEGRDYSYFSPEFYVDESGRVAGIPAVGPIGGLVNTPAFQTIERLAAALTKEDQNMNEDELKAAQQKVADLTAERETLKASLAEAEAKKAELQTQLDSANATIEAARKAGIEKDVDALVAAKRVSAEGKEALVAACLSAADNGKALLAAMPAAPAAANPPLHVRPGQSPSESVTAKCAAALGKTI